MRSSLQNLPAPAKINWFLHITGRRADGYHELQTAFQFIDYCDTLSFTLTADGSIRHTQSIAGLDINNDLCLQAARQLQQLGKVKHGVAITLAKRIPMGGGLGGGSSDAATTLLALNQLWDLKLSLSELAAIGLQLGADVPVFVHGQAAWAEGVGEKLTPINLPEDWYLVVAPPIHIATQKIFNAPDLIRNCAPITLDQLLHAKSGNVCEAVVRQQYPSIAQLLDWLAEYGNSRMTGTGACVFSRFASQQAAVQALAELTNSAFYQPDWRAFIARGLNQSPLFTKLTKLI